MCERHGIHKDTHWHHLCQTRVEYRKAWDEGHGPGQILTSGNREKVEKAEGWGDKVAVLLKRIGVTEEGYKAVKEKFGLPPTCGCAKRREWLNRVGEWWNGRNE